MSLNRIIIVVVIVVVVVVAVIVVGNVVVVVVVVIITISMAKIMVACRLRACARNGSRIAISLRNSDRARRRTEPRLP